MNVIYHNIKRLLTLQSAAKKQGRFIKEEDLSVIEDAVIVVRAGRIKWVGRKKDFTGLKGTKINLRGLDIMPSFVECHTHLLFAGDRKNEFEARNKGQSYIDIAKAGGGIQSTVSSTRDSKDKELLKLARERVLKFIHQGATTIEVKTGYGLTVKDELRLLKIINKIKKGRVISTFLGPHAVPKDMTKEAYLAAIIEALPKVRRLTERVDMFIEDGFFNMDDAKAYFLAAKRLNFKMVGHTDQLSRTGGSVFLAEHEALSVDHVLKVDDSDIDKLAKSNTTCVLLPTSDFYLKIPYPKARKLIDSGARVALATDFNPGTAPSQDIGFTGVLARLKMQMTLPEVIVAYTLNGAQALGLGTELGSLEVGKQADFIATSDWQNLFYEVGQHQLSGVWSCGRPLLKTKI